MAHSAVGTDRAGRVEQRRSNQRNSKWQRDVGFLESMGDSLRQCCCCYCCVFFFLKSWISTKLVVSRSITALRAILTLITCFYKQQGPKRMAPIALFGFFWTCGVLVTMDVVLSSLLTVTLEKPPGGWGRGRGRVIYPCCGQSKHFRSGGRPTRVRRFPVETGPQAHTVPVTHTHHTHTLLRPAPLHAFWTGSVANIVPAMHIKPYLLT